MNQEIKDKLIKAGYKGEFGLSELIDACGEIIIKSNNPDKEYQSYFELGMNINHNGNYEEIGKINEWRASIINGIDETFVSLYNYFGNTPEEAVAKLWLELNKK